MRYTKKCILNLSCILFTAIIPAFGYSQEEPPVEEENEEIADVSIEIGVPANRGYMRDNRRYYRRYYPDYYYFDPYYEPGPDIYYWGRFHHDYDDDDGHRGRHHHRRHR
jgi:hypothetical protein